MTDKADAIIAALDELGTTQKNKATRPKEARFRPAVDVWLEANGSHVASILNALAAAKRQ